MYKRKLFCVDGTDNIKKRIEKYGEAMR